MEREMKYKIEFCRGSNEGGAIYISDDTGGYRAFGEKCWGYVKPVMSFELTEDNIDSAVKELKRIKAKIRVDIRKRERIEAR
jgi:hypothetical protein